jgi:hypothetical protein
MAFKRTGIKELEGGWARISVGRATLVRLHQLAGDDGIAKYLRELTIRELKDKQGVLPTDPPMSLITMASLKQDMGELKLTLARIEAAAVKPETMRDRERELVIDAKDWVNRKTHKDAERAAAPAQTELLRELRPGLA